uniref:Uncharacterized protein n=1 Tax=Panagrolaimus davidi TaxID=227884 RepID=A0A914PIT5_9BILA
MTAGSQCCCFHVKTCAIIVSIMGIVSCCMQLICILILWWYSPISFLMLIVYIFVLVGVSKERPGFLVPAEIIMGILVGLSLIVVIALIIIGIAVPDGIVESFKDDDNYNYDDAKAALRVAFFLLAFIVLVANSHNIFSFIVIRRCRKWLSENPGHSGQTYPIVYGAAPPSVQVYHSGPPPPQQPYGAPGYPQQQQYMPQQYPQQQQYNPGQQPYPQAYHPSPQPSPQPGYHA